MVTGIQLLRQDCLGLESYLSSARDHWVDMPWEFDALLIVFGVISLGIAIVADVKRDLRWGE